MSADHNPQEAETEAEAAAATTTKQRHQVYPISGATRPVPDPTRGYTRSPVHTQAIMSDDRAPTE